MYRDELVCSHLDGIFVKKNLSFQLWPLCCCFFTPIISLGYLNQNKDVMNHLFRLQGRLVYCLLLHVIRESCIFKNVLRGTIPVLFIIFGMFKNNFKIPIHDT